MTETSEAPGARPPFDVDTEFGARVAGHLQEETVVWLTTVSAAGAPVPSPVWFHWDGADRVRVYSLPDTPRAKNIAANPRVTLNFAGDGRGGDIVVLKGTAGLDPGGGSALDDAAYLAKYSAGLERIGATAEMFAQKYSMVVTITVTGVRGH
jgi:PPOX class probable F420-dependent enzyme